MADPCSKKGSMSLEYVLDTASAFSIPMFNMHLLFTFLQRLFIFYQKFPETFGGLSIILSGL